MLGGVGSGSTTRAASRSSAYNSDELVVFLLWVLAVAITIPMLSF